jgi:hypothetical protein
MRWLFYAEVSLLRKANEGLSKRRRAKKKRVQLGGSLSIQEGQDLIDQRAINEQVAQETRQSSRRIRGSRAKIRCCGVCGKPGHNARTCAEDAELSTSSISILV